MIVFWILLIILSGILMSFAHHFRFSNIEIDPQWWSILLASLGMAVFMKVSSLRSRMKVRFALGMLGGFVYFSITLYWISIALRQFGNLNFPTAFGSPFLLSGYFAVFYGLWALIAGFESVRQKPIFIRIVLWASLWAGLEALREHLFTGFAWGEIGYAFAYWPVLGQTAAVWGVHGLSFLWVLIVCLLLHLDEWASFPKTRTKGLGLLIALLLVGFLGSWFTKGRPSDENIRVALIQPNIDQGAKWDPERASLYLRRLLNMSQESLSSEPDLIVWPETAYPFLVSEGQRQLPFTSPVPTLVGAVVSNRQINYNSALFVEGDQIQARFNKIHLVPFGEYVPFEEYLPFGKLVENVGRFVSGTKDQDLFQLESGIELGPLICYEDIFSRHSVNLVRRGADLLVNMTNDAWYGESSAQKQHAAIARMRSFETQRPMVRATNTGLSVVFYRDKMESIEMEEIGSLIADVSLASGAKSSFFVWSYPLMQWIWWAIFAIGVGWKVRYPKKRIFFRKS